MTDWSRVGLATISMCLCGSIVLGHENGTIDHHPDHGYEPSPYRPGPAQQLAVSSNYSIGTATAGASDVLYRVAMMEE
jgi:hypothetical protein